MKAKNYLHTLRGVMLLSALYIQEAYSQVPPASCFQRTVMLFEKRDFQDIPSIERKIEEYKRSWGGSLPFQVLASDITPILDCLKKQNEQVNAEKYRITEKMNEIYIQKNTLSGNNDLSSLKAQIQQKKDAIENIKREVKEQLSTVKFYAVYVVMLHQGSGIAKDANVFLNEARKATAPKAIEDLNGIFMESIQRNDAENNFQETIQQSIEGNMDIINEQIIKGYINDYRQYMLIMTVSVSPLKKQGTSTEGASLPNNLYTLYTELPANITYEDEKQKGLFSEKWKEASQYVKRQNTSAEQNQNNILNRISTQINDNTTDLKALTKKYDDRVKKLKKTLADIQISFDENSIDAKIKQGTQTIDSKIKQLENELIQKTSEGWGLGQPAHVPLKSERPITDIANNILSARDRFNEAEKITLYENKQQIQNGQYTEQTNQTLEVSRTLQRCWVYLSKSGREWEIQVIAKYNVQQNQGASPSETATDKDSDSDGIPDSKDACPTQYAKTTNGCPQENRSYTKRIEKDSDSDGIPDSRDKCPTQYAKTTNGCPQKNKSSTKRIEKDSDSDGIPDSKDECPREYARTTNGCPEADSDSDGIPDSRDNCPQEYAKTTNGCPEKTTTDNNESFFTKIINWIKELILSVIGRGCISGDCDNGYGTYITTIPYLYPTKYVGNWKDGKKNGQGTYTFSFSDGRKYDGNWENDKKNGQGTMTFPSGTKYVGNWENDKKNGQGTMTWPDGRKYVGNWENDKRHGQGTYTSPGGAKYVGNWKDSKKNGQGTMTWPDGEKYVGNWKDDKRHGQGTMTWPDGDKYVGNWENDKKNGPGTYTRPDGEKYVGNFENDKKNGQGTYTRPDGAKYVGNWKDGEPHGQGTMTWPSGAKYVGNWENGENNGQGTYTYFNGDKYDGNWKDSERHGRGTQYNRYGNIIQSGYWKDGEFVGNTFVPDE